MYQIYSTIRGGSYSGASVSQIIMSFDTLTAANLAYDRLIEVDTSDIGTKVIVRLYEREGDEG